MTVRSATPADIDAIVELVGDLAEYEHARDQVELTPELLRAGLFGPDAAASAHVAEDASGRVVGMALWFRTYSTWTGVAGIHLEDLYVRPEERGAGYGRALLAALAQTCVERGYARLEWSVLDWNESAIGFYRSLGAVPQDEWTTWRLDGAGLTTVGARSES
jgi:GNAT superfamily N-acetyltransferase